MKVKFLNVLLKFLKINTIMLNKYKSCLNEFTYIYTGFQTSLSKSMQKYSNYTNSIANWKQTYMQFI